MQRVVIIINSSRINAVGIYNSKRLVSFGPIMYNHSPYGLVFIPDKFLGLRPRIYLQSGRTLPALSLL